MCDLMWNDFGDLVNNYYSFYDEVATDTPDLGVIFHERKPEYHEEVEWFSGPYSACLRRQAMAVVAGEGGKAVGACVIRRERPGSEIDQKGTLGIIVGREHRRKGVGTELIRAAFERCRGKFEIVQLSVLSVNKPAIALYKKFGFSEIGLLPKSVKRNGKYYDKVQTFLMIDH